MNNRGNCRPNYVASHVVKSQAVDWLGHGYGIKWQANHQYSIQKHLDRLLVSSKSSAFLPLLCAGRAPSTWRSRAGGKWHSADACCIPAKTLLYFQTFAILIAYTKLVPQLWIDGKNLGRKVPPVPQSSNSCALGHIGKLKQLIQLVLQTTLGCFHELGVLVFFLVSVQSRNLSCNFYGGYVPCWTRSTPSFAIPGRVRGAGAGLRLLPPCSGACWTRASVVSTAAVLAGAARRRFCCRRRRRPPPPPIPPPSHCRGRRYPRSSHRRRRRCFRRHRRRTRRRRWRRSRFCRRFESPADQTFRVSCRPELERTLHTLANTPLPPHKPVPSHIPPSAIVNPKGFPLQGFPPRGARAKHHIQLTLSHCHASYVLPTSPRSHRLRMAPAAYCHRRGRHDSSHPCRVWDPLSHPQRRHASGASLAASHAPGMACPPGAAAAESELLDNPSSRPPQH